MHSSLTLSNIPIRGLHRLDFPGPGLAAISARPEREIEISVRARPNERYKILAKAIFFFDFGQDHLILSDFKIGPFSCLHIINGLFADDLFFRFSIDCFPLNFIKRTSYYRNKKKNCKTGYTLRLKLPSI